MHALPSGPPEQLAPVGMPIYANQARLSQHTRVLIDGIPRTSNEWEVLGFGTRAAIPTWHVRSHHHRLEVVACAICVDIAPEKRWSASALQDRSDVNANVKGPAPSALN